MGSGVVTGGNNGAAGGNSTVAGGISTVAGGISEVGPGASTDRRISHDGLNPNRQKGFDMQFPRIETPRLTDMKAKQSAIVARFLTFAQRKSSLVVELYNTVFYKQKPNWDKIANFVYGDLCPQSDLRREVIDVQFHPVKMLIFLKFSDDNWRDKAVERLQSSEGVIWKEYNVKVKGYSLDAEVKHFRVLGVSPETSAAEIKQLFAEVGIGEVLDIKKGMLDERRMPGVSNGTWSLRVKISDPEKYIPSYIHRRDEGEIWSLNFEGRVFCCWKCGSGDHIGDKCRDQTKTFEEVFNSSNPDFTKPTWATVVRSGKGVSDLQEERTRKMELRLKQLNRRRQTANLDPEINQDPPQKVGPQIEVVGPPEDTVTDS